VSDIYANARALSGYLKEQSYACDEARRLPSDVVARVREAGLFRLTMPRIWGGPELSTIEQVEVIEELSRANSAVGWCVMIGCDSGIYSLDPATGQIGWKREDLKKIPEANVEELDGYPLLLVSQNTGAITTENHLVAVDLVSGENAWERLAAAL